LSTLQSLRKKMKKKLAGMLCALVGLVLISSLGTVRLADAAPETSAAVLNSAFGANCVTCDPECQGPQGAHHVSASAGAGTRHNFAHPDVCGPGTCDDLHPTGCKGGEETDFDLAASWQAAVRQDYARTTRELVENSTVVALNVDRRALQWYGCDGSVIASLPLEIREFEKLKTLSE